MFHKAVNTKCSGQSICNEFDENVNLSNVTLQSLAKMKVKFQQSTGNSNTHEMDNLKYKVVHFHEDGNTSNADDTSCTDVSKFKSRVAQYNSVSCDVTSMCNMCTYTENAFSPVHSVLSGVPAAEVNSPSKSLLEISSTPNKLDQFIEILSGDHKQDFVDLTNLKMLYDVSTKLQECNLLTDFVNFLYSLASDEISPDIVPFRALLDTAHFYNLSDTCSMWYDPIMKEFWHVVFKCLGGPALHLFSGPRGTGQAVFDPKLCKINFAVPSLSMLEQLHTATPKLIFPSIFEDVLIHLQRLQEVQFNEYVLSYDGKGVTQGFRGQSFGGENLWGFEGPPNIEEQEKRLLDELRLVEKMNQYVNYENHLDQLHHIREMIQIISLHIKDLRNKISSHSKVIVRYEKLSEQNPQNQDKYQWVISVNNEQVMQARSLIRRCLNVNRDLCCSAAKINGSFQNFSHSFHIHLEEQSNYLSLIPPHLIPEFFENGQNTMYIQQGSDLWFQNRNLALVTGSLCFDVLGLNTLAVQKNHYDHYVLKKPKEITPETQANFNHRNPRMK